MIIAAVVEAVVVVAVVVVVVVVSKLWFKVGRCQNKDTTIQSI